MCTQERPKILQTPISLHVTEQIFREDSLHLHLSQHNWREAQEDTQLASYSSLHISVFWSGKWGYVTHIDMLRCWCRAQLHKAQPFRLTGIYWRLLYPFLFHSIPPPAPRPPTHTGITNENPASSPQGSCSLPGSSFRNITAPGPTLWKGKTPAFWSTRSAHNAEILCQPPAKIWREGGGGSAYIASFSLSLTQGDRP